MTPNLLNRIRDLSPHAAFHAGMAHAGRRGWMHTARLASLHGDTSRVEQAVHYARSENRSLVRELLESRRASLLALTHMPDSGTVPESP